MTATRIKGRRSQQEEDSGPTEKTMAEMPQASILTAQRRSPRIVALTEAAKSNAAAALNQTSATDEQVHEEMILLRRELVLTPTKWYEKTGTLHTNLFR